MTKYTTKLNRDKKKTILTVILTTFILPKALPTLTDFGNRDLSLSHSKHTKLDVPKRTKINK